MKFIYLLIAQFLIVTTALAQNIMISNQNSPNEPSISIDPNHPEYLVAATNLRNYYVSVDTGHTWTVHTLNSSYGVWGDPVIDVDTSGNFYFFHLSNPASGNWIDRIVCQKSSDHGNTWTDGTFTGLNGTKAQDKQWSIVDRNNNNIYLTWTQFDSYGSNIASDSSMILFSKSIDEGNTWSNPVRINEIAGNCIDSDDTVEGAVPAVGPNGEIYVSWAGPAGLVFDRSVDQGNTWLAHDIPVTDIPEGWDFDIPGISRCNGLPITKCDISQSAYQGTIYINWADQRNGVNDTDIWLVKSTNGGSTWSNPARVNDDVAGKHQFLTWMDIDQTTGYLYFIFYDRRNYNTQHTDVYLAISKDGGETFENRMISESPFVPNEGVFFGDYSNVVAHNGIVRPIWTRMDGGVTSVWTDISNDELVSVVRPSDGLDNNQVLQYPNPSNGISYVSFKLHERANINLALFDQQGKKVYTIIENEQKGYGKYVIPINVVGLNIPNAIYYCKLSIDGNEKMSKMIIVK